jgi:hypothetical protein
MTQDTIVEEIRRGREEHAARFNYDLSQIFADLKRTEQGRNEEDFPLLARLGLKPTREAGRWRAVWA